MRNTLVLCAIISGLFVSAYFLFAMPLITVVYPLILSAIAAAIAAAAGHVSRARRHRAIERREMPAPKDIIEEDYQNIIHGMEEAAKAGREQAAEAYRDMIEYYTVWAHQIKTPIAAMKLQLQAEDSSSARQLGSELNRIEGYVSMAMAYLRLDSEDTDYLIREYRIDDIIRPVIRRFSREFILKKLTLSYETPEIKVITDEKWLAFVLEQVISNAVKYTGEGGTIRIYCKGEDCLCIEDTGIGIKPEDLPRIFEKGYTGFNGRQDKSASGIGLFLCRRILKNLGHGIFAESEQGKGTRITLEFRQQPIQVE